MPATQIRDWAVVAEFLHTLSNLGRSLSGNHSEMYVSAFVPSPMDLALNGRTILLGRDLRHELRNILEDHVCAPSWDISQFVRPPPPMSSDVHPLAGFRLLLLVAGFSLFPLFPLSSSWTFNVEEIRDLVGLWPLLSCPSL